MQNAINVAPTGNGKQPSRLKKRCPKVNPSSPDDLKVLYIPRMTKTTTTNKTWVDTHSYPALSQRRGLFGLVNVPQTSHRNPSPDVGLLLIHNAQTLT